MKRVPEPGLAMTRASLPEGCSDLIDAYKIRANSQQERSRFILRLSALLHDPLLSQLDPEVLHSLNQNLLMQRISDFLHPILLSNPDLEKQVKPSSDLVEILFQVVMANIEDRQN